MRAIIKGVSLQHGNTEEVFLERVIFNLSLKKRVGVHLTDGENVFEKAVQVLGIAR